MKRAACLLIALAVPLAACGGDDSSSSTAATTVTTTVPGDPTTTTTASDSTASTTTPESDPGGDTPTPTTAGEPAATGQASVADDGSITIEHAYGTTTLDGPPQRIVALDRQWADVLLELGAPLVATVEDPLAADTGGIYPWQIDALTDDVSLITVDPSGTVLPYEAVAAARPDLIVASWQVLDDASYEQLSSIAPTIPLLSERQVDRWEDIAAVSGVLVGDPAGATALSADMDASLNALAAELPGLAGKTYVMANYVAGSAITVVADPDDGAAQTFARLGLEIDPDLVAAADGATGRIDISLERIGDLDADLLLILTNGADTSDIPGYSTLPAVQTGAAQVINMAEAVALNTPSPMSLRWVLDSIRPALDAAAAS